ncbi:MAG: tail fiber domain-containing protein [Bacteroidales bacterium]|nr:tail fiber domain-containing protein [Bacteroidales bacterium]
MRKKSIIILIAGFLSSAMISEAQVEVVSDGTVRVGADNYDPGDKDFTVMDVQHSTSTNYDAYSSMRMDNVNNYLYLNRRSSRYRNEIIFYSFTTDVWHMGLNDSDDTPYSNINSFFIGKNIGGSNPFIWLDYSDNSIGLFTRDPDSSYELTLSGDALAYGGIWQNSDIDLKQNINRIESSLEKLLAIRGVTYEYNSEYEKLVSFEDFDSQNSTYVDSSGVVQSQSVEDISNPISKNKYGVIAQEVMEQFPDLVHKGSNGYYAVNYNGLIPILIEAIKEQQTIIDNIQNELHVLKESNLKSLTSNDEKVFLSIPVLYQNNPNPFTQNTSIKYNLPESYTNGYINIYDLNGKQIKSIALAKAGESSILVYGGELKAGMYLYSLIVDGQIIDTKQMVLTE